MKNKGNINLNIKLINNNNYNNVPLMIYNKQSNKLNNINHKIDKKNSNIINKNKLNKNNKKITNISKPLDSNRVNKYTFQRNTIPSGYDEYDKEETFPIDDDVHNKIKNKFFTKHKTNLYGNLPLYH